MSVRERIAYVDPWEVAYYNALIEIVRSKDNTIKIGRKAVEFGELAVQRGEELIKAYEEIARLKCIKV